MLMMPETVKINPLMFQIPVSHSQGQLPTAGLYQRQQRTNNTRGIRRHLREQESLPNLSSLTATPRSSQRSRPNRLSIEFEDANTGPSTNVSDVKPRSKSGRSSSNSKQEEALTGAKSEEIRSQSQMLTRRDCRRHRAYSNEWDVIEDDADEEGFEEKRRNAPERKSIGGVTGVRRGRSKPGPMETLDRRISASTDHLDTLKKEKRAGRGAWAGVQDDLDHGRMSRVGRPHTSASCHAKRPRSGSRPNQTEINNNNSDKSNDKPFVDSTNEVTINYNGEKISKSRYFFGDILQKSPSNSSGQGINRPRNKSRLGFRKEERVEKPRKTAVDLFLEDEGPYSRKLYGPPPKEGTSKKATINTKRAKSQEIVPEVSEDSGIIDACPLKKGLLWQQKDKLFSRWKERYFVLTKDYFHCFKKATSRITEMGGFIFKLKLVDIESVELLDKRGYLTICISLLREGKVYLRRPEGIRDWYNALQNNIYESKRRKKFWVKKEITDSANIQQWLLTRQKVGIHYPTANCSSSPDLLETSTSPTRTTGNHNHNLDNDSGHEGDENNSNDKSSKQIEDDRRLVLGPRGINRMSLVSELILKEKFSSEVCPSSKVMPELSSGDSVLGDSNSSARSSGSGPSTVSNSVESPNKVPVGPTSISSTTGSSTKETTRTLTHRRVEDSGNDSGHNSMNTNSDTQSDATNSSGEEPSRASVLTKSIPSKSALRSDSDCKKSQNAGGLNLRIPTEGDIAAKSSSVRAIFQKRNSKIFKSPQSPKSLDSDLHLTTSAADSSPTSNESSASLIFESSYY